MKNLHDGRTNRHNGLPLTNIERNNTEQALQERHIEQRKMQRHAQRNRGHEHGIRPQRQSKQALGTAQRVHRIQHLNDDQDGQRDGRCRLGHVIAEHLAADFRERARALVEVTELVEGDLRTRGIEHEPPGVAEDGGGADVRADDHVGEEQPAADEGLVALAGLALHDVVVRGVEGEGGGGEAVGDEVDPEELDGDERFGHPHGSGEEDRYDFADVGGDEVADELLRVVVNGAAFFDGAFDGGKVVVYEDHVGGEFGDIGSGAHGYTNVGFLESGRVVDTVTSHGDDFTGLLEEVNELGLVGGLSTGEERCVFGGVHLLGITEVIELASSVALSSEIFIGSKDTDLATDGLGGVLVVSSNDDNTDTSGPALRDGVADFRTRGIQHAAEADESHVLFELSVFFGGLSLGEKRVGANVINGGQSDNTKTTVAVFDDFLVDEASEVLVHGDLLTVASNNGVGAASKDRFRSTLDEKLVRVAVLDQDRHTLAVARELVGGYTGQLVLVVLARKVEALFGGGIGTSCVELSVRSADFLDQDTESALGGLTNEAVSAVLGVVCEVSFVAEGGNFADLANSSGGRSQVTQSLSLEGDLALRSEAGSLDIEFLKSVTILANEDHLVDTHLVGSQSTSLV